MSTKFVAPNVTIYDFFNSFVIECPRCRKKASIVKKNVDSGFDGVEVLSCSHCGFIKEGRRLYSSISPELWLTINCCGRELWALNYEHLNFIEKYVEAILRESETSEHGYRNQSLASRLPKWIQSSKNRDSILKAIRKLKEK